MSERRYMLTKDQIMILKNLGGETFNDYLSTITTDPEPSGEAVSLIDQITSCHSVGMKDGEIVILREKKKIEALLTAEVTRQVEERTKGYLEVEPIGIPLNEASWAFVHSWDKRRFGPMTAELWNNCKQDVVKPIVEAYLKALANKGGSDE